MTTKRIWMTAAVLAFAFFAAGGELAAQGPFPNLTASGFSAPSCAELGEVVGSRITITETNTGAANLPAGSNNCAGSQPDTTCSTIGFYVSTDATITTSDVLLTGGRENLYGILGGDGVDFNIGDSVSDFLVASASINNGSPTGNVFIGVIVDELATVTESNESDNTASQPILIVAAGSGGCAAPDLVVDSLTHAPANPTTDDNIRFTAVVKNIGTASAPASTLMFKIGGETPGAPATLFSVPSLAPGESASFERTQTLIAQSYINTATADWNEDVAESDENNNTTTDSYTVTEPDEPGPTANLIFQIVQLPIKGILKDSQGTQITAVPYSLPDAKVQYTPNTGYSGPDLFEYQIADQVTGLVSGVAAGYLNVAGLTCATCFPLSVDFIGPGKGTVRPYPDPQGGIVVCEDDCTLQVPSGATVKLQARPADGGFVFQGWGGACSSANLNPIAEVNVGSGATCTASFGFLIIN